MKLKSKLKTSKIKLLLEAENIGNAYFAQAQSEK